MYAYKPAKQNTEKTEPHVLAKSSPLYTQPSMQRMADKCTIKLCADKLVQRKGNALLDDYLARQTVVQREEVPEEEEVLQGKFADTAQREALDEEEELLQGKFETVQREELDEEELLQGKFETTQRKENSQSNKTGLPDNLKSGVETLSGHSMDNVRVHYNSPKPAQLQALAYTQGTNIHIAPGQEKHLPHEAWHVVQQMQGRVQPTMQMQGVNVNDNEGLEREADVMGEEAVQCQKTHKMIMHANLKKANTYQFKNSRTPNWYQQYQKFPAIHEQGIQHYINHVEQGEGAGGRQQGLHVLDNQEKPLALRTIVEKSNIGFNSIGKILWYITENPAGQGTSNSPIPVKSSSVFPLRLSATHNAITGVRAIMKAAASGNTTAFDQITRGAGLSEQVIHLNPSIYPQAPPLRPPDTHFQKGSVYYRVL